MRDATRTATRWIAALTAGAALLSGCGDDDEQPAALPTPPAATEAGPPSQAVEPVEVTLSATEGDGLAFSEESLQAASGQVSLVMRNEAGNTQQHAIAILGGNGQSVAGDTVDAGKISRVTATLAPGDYTFFCPVGNHRRQGMEGVLVVE